MSQFQLLGSDWTITAALNLPPEVPAPYNRAIFVKSPATQCITCFTRGLEGGYRMCVVAFQTLLLCLLNRC